MRLSDGGVWGEVDIMYKEWKVGIIEGVAKLKKKGNDFKNEINGAKK